MTTLTAKLIWTKLNEDTRFLGKPVSIREAVRHFFEAMPVVIADFLDRPVTVTNILEAKIVFLRYTIDNGICGATLSGFSDAFLRGLDKDFLLEIMRVQMDETLSKAEILLADLPTIIDQSGLSDQEILLNPDSGLNDEARRLYQSGELTVGGLLTVQPYIPAILSRFHS